MNNRKKQNKFNKLCIFLLTAVFLSLLCFNLLPQEHIFAYASLNEPKTIDTIFMYSPTQGVQINGKTYVLDTKNNSIVIIENNTLVQGKNSIMSSYGANHIFTIDKYLLLLNTTSLDSRDYVRIFDTETQEEVINAISLSGQNLTSFDKVSSYKSGNTLYLLLYSLDTNNGVKEMLYFSIDYDNEIWTFTSPQTLTINTQIFGNNFQENIKSINLWIR